jgi:hypothetical protein
MHPALYSWREELARAFVRVLAYVGAAAVLSIAAAYLVQRSNTAVPEQPAAKSDWVDIDRVFPAFALSIPEAADVPAHYAIRRNTVGNGRMDVLTLGRADGTDPYLEVRIYRPGTEITHFGLPQIAVASGASSFAPVNIRAPSEPLDSKFGPLDIVTFDAGRGAPRRCLAFVRSWGDPMLQLSGWFCRGGEFIQRSTLACALDRLTLLSAGSEPRIGALFAKAELNRSFCGQRDPILAPTPKYRLLWKALESRRPPGRGDP